MLHFMEVRAEDEAAVCAWFGPVFVHVWKHAPTLSSARSIRASMREFLRRPIPAECRGLSMLGVLTPGAGPPDPDVRGELAAMQSESLARLRAAAFVVEETGFRSARLRSAVTDIDVLAKLKGRAMSADLRDRLRIFDSLKDAVAWLGPLCGDIAEIPTALEYLR